MNIPEWLSRLATIASIRTLFRRQIQVAFVEIPENEISFLDFAQLIVDLFADGQLKRLKMVKRISPKILQTLENLQEGLCLLVDRLPRLAHLKIRMATSHFSNRNNFNCKQMESWFSTEAISKLARPIHWRCDSSKIDLWL